MESIEHRGYVGATMLSHRVYGTKHTCDNRRRINRQHGDFQSVFLDQVHAKGLDERRFTDTRRACVKKRNHIVKFSLHHEVGKRCRETRYLKHI